MARRGAATAGAPRILVVGPTPPPAHGVAVLTECLLNSELARRYELVHLDTRDARGVSNIGRLDVGNVRLAGLHAARFTGLLMRQRPDLVYMPVAQNVLGFARDALLMGPARLRGVPLVLHFHGGRFDEFYAGAGPLRPLIRGLVGGAARAIVLGDALRDMLAGIVARDRIRVVPNGVADVGPANGRAGNGPLRVLFIGNLRPDKGYIDLLEAGSMLLNENVELELTFVGGISDPRAHAAALARLRRSMKHVSFTGPLEAEERDSALRSADVLVLPSRDEAHPLVVLEAMSAALPVVATRHSTLPETVLDGQTGILVDIGSPDQIAAALTRLRDPALRERLGRAGRSRYLAEYTLRRWEERMIAVFDDAFGERAA